MTRTLAAKVIEGLHDQGWEIIGYGGTWAGAMRPLEEYVKRKVERAVAAEREACAKELEAIADRIPVEQREGFVYKTVIECVAAIRARGEKK